MHNPLQYKIWGIVGGSRPSPTVYLQHKKKKEKANAFSFFLVPVTGIDEIKVWLGQALASGAHSRRI